MSFGGAASPHRKSSSGINSQWADFMWSAAVGQDGLGELTQPRPFDWASWRNEHLAPAEPPPGLSRLKAEMWRKKTSQGVEGGVELSRARE
jgi:hypothetical protein